MSRTFTVDVGGKIYELRAWYYETRHTWGHKAELSCREADGYDHQLASRKITYYNRTWEAWKFQTVLYALLGEFEDGIMASLADKAKKLFGVTRMTPKVKAYLVGYKNGSVNKDLIEHEYEDKMLSVIGSLKEKMNSL